jgi:hypothetical protein
MRGWQMSLNEGTGRKDVARCGFGWRRVVSVIWILAFSWGFVACGTGVMPGRVYFEPQTQVELECYQRCRQKTEQCIMSPTFDNDKGFCLAGCESDCHEGEVVCVQRCRE